MVKKDIIPKWTSIRIRNELYNEVEKMLHKDSVKKLGISSISQFVTNAISEYVEELEQKNMSHVNVYDDHVKIMDRELGKIGRIVSVYFKKGNKPWCDYCRESDCIHVQYAWEIADVRKILEKYGFSPPPSRV